ncbi:hypothetical protein EGW08_022035 [Elysia chlorotica]|uniref:Uncharacterized protein n=1 Tax=Elysia chlorotica TaxID=188477 RepID=A0A3S1BLZ8_ELYCH|nr:hypothetical protein EGW08_022035 [Elysia chlorotica]
MKDFAVVENLRDAQTCPWKLVLATFINAVSIRSVAWLTVSHFISGHRTCDPVDSDTSAVKDTDRTLTTTAPSVSSPCWTQHYQWLPVSSAGLWGLCFTAPSQPNGTAPFCADFTDDVVPAVWLTLLQTGSVLSPCLCLLALLFLASVRLKTWTEEFTAEWLACKLLLVSGVCGIAASGAFIHLMTPEFLSSFESNFVLVSKDWALFVYIYGSLLHLVASICTVEVHAPKRKGLKII